MKTTILKSTFAFLMVFLFISCDDNMDDIITKEIDKAQGISETPENGSDTGIGQWELLKNTGIALSNSAAIEYNGWLYIHGGENALGTVNIFWRINLTTGSIESLGSDIYLSAHDMALINGVIYLFGGKDENGNAVNTFRTYDLDITGSPGWITDIEVSDTNGPFPLPRFGHRTFAYNGYFFVYGGIDDSGYIDNALYRFEPTGPLDTHKPRWEKINLEGPALMGAGTALNDDILYVFGGYDSAGEDGYNSVNNMWRYDLTLNQWSSIAVPETVVSRGWIRIAAFEDEIISLWGEGDAGTIDTGFGYDFTGEWYTLNEEPDARSFYTMNTWSGNAVIYGGYNSSSSLYYDDIWILSLE